MESCPLAAGDSAPSAGWSDRFRGWDSRDSDRRDVDGGEVGWAIAGKGDCRSRPRGLAGEDGGGNHPQNVPGVAGGRSAAPDCGEIGEACSDKRTPRHFVEDGGIAEIRNRRNGVRLVSEGVGGGQGGVAHEMSRCA